MSKMIFVKYLPPARPKLAPKLKYLVPVWPKLVPKLKMLRIYGDLVHLMFQIYQFRF